MGWETKLLESSFAANHSDAFEKAITFLSERHTSEKQLETSARITLTLCSKGLDVHACIAYLCCAAVKEKKGSIQEIKNAFGERTAELAQEHMMISEVIEKNATKLTADTLSSLVISISSDMQSIIMLLAESADELETEKWGADEQRIKIEEAKNIFAPLATKLGLGDFAWRIQDYSFRRESPSEWARVKKLINKPREEREKLVNDVISEVRALFDKKMKVHISGRPKNFRAISEKLKKVAFKDMHDLYGVRIIVDKDKECYEALGYIHAAYEIIPEAFDDYLAKPKTNGYRSIHTAVKRGKDTIEFQIRTWKDHLRIESSLYWDYKRLKKDREFEKELGWERQLIEWQKENTIERKRGLGKKIFVFTPKNDVIPLPPNASVIDFAFAVHTDIGKRMMKARVNGEFVPIESKLKNLDRVEILTAPKPQAKKSWLTFVVTEKAKSKLRNHFMLASPAAKKALARPSENDLKRIKLADCCHPLPGEDVVGVRTTKRKIIIHKKTCTNITALPKTRLMEISFEKERGKSEIRITAADRIGLLAEILEEIKSSGAKLTGTNFKIKKNGYVEALFTIEISSVMKLENLMEKISHIPAIYSVERG